MNISIRTPAWGVTRMPCSGRPCRSISIRTPAWGVTYIYGEQLLVDVFQFAPPRGG